MKVSYWKRCILDQLQAYLSKHALFSAANFGFGHGKFLAYHCWRGSSNAAVFLTSFSKIIAQTENNRTFESKIDATLCGKQITGNCSDPMETVLKIISSKVSSFGKCYYVTWAYALIQVKFLFSYRDSCIDFCSIGYCRTRTIS